MTLRALAHNANTYHTSVLITVSSVCLQFTPWRPMPWITTHFSKGWNYARGVLVQVFTVRCVWIVRMFGVNGTGAASTEKEIPERRRSVVHHK